MRCRVGGTKKQTNKQNIEMLCGHKQMHSLGFRDLTQIWWHEILIWLIYEVESFLWEDYSMASYCCN